MQFQRKSLSKRYLPWVLSALFVLSFSVTAAADYVRVKGTVLNVRQGPGTTHPVLFSAEKGEEFPLLSTEGLWCRIRLQGGKEAWVYSKLVDVLPGDIPGTTQAAPIEEKSKAGQEGWSTGGKLAFALFLAVILLVGFWKRREILHYTGRRLREISGYKRDQAFRYDNRKPSDDSWEI